VEEVANDFPALFAEYPKITHVFFKRQEGGDGFSPSRTCEYTRTSSRETPPRGGSEWSKRPSQFGEGQISDFDAG
jgi:hypothetical protein